ncbi:MAG: carbohydrate ABC transporter permease [Candidatus Humimicrobiaceae bacterium]
MFHIKIKRTKVLTNIALLFIVTIFAFPLFYLVKTSLELRGFTNYYNALTKVNLFLYIRNSFIVTFSTVCLVSVITVPAAFIFSKIKFRLKNVLYLIIIITLMVPGISIVVPLVKIIKAFGLFNNYLSLILIYTALNIPLSLILAKGFMDQLPKELVEASIIDGCSVFRMFISIFLPLSKPILAIIWVLTALSSWNEFIFAKLFMTKESMEMVTTIPIKFQNNFYTDIPGLFAALVLIQLPIVILFLSFQRVFIEGITAGAIKS